MQILVIFQEIIIEEKIVAENDDQELTRIGFRLNFSESATKFSKQLLNNVIQIEILCRLFLTTTDNFMNDYKKNINIINEAYKHKPVLLKFKFIKKKWHIIKIYNKYKVIV